MLSLLKGLSCLRYDLARLGQTLIEIRERVPVPAARRTGGIQVQGRFVLTRDFNTVRRGRGRARPNELRT